MFSPLKPEARIAFFLAFGLWFYIRARDVNNVNFTNGEKMSEVNYRYASPEDIPEMADLFLLALNDMYARNAVSALVPPRPAVLQGYEHIRSTGIFQVAELEGRIVAIAGAVVRDQLWYLSAFWAHPELQRKKIGMPLLKKVWEAGKEAGATIFFTWSSIDLTAMASYMKLGMLPGYQNFFFDGVPKQLPDIPSNYKVAPLEKPMGLEIDQQVRGTSRQPDHDFWFSNPNLQKKQVLHKGNAIGYYYLNRGMIGPAGWKAPHHAEPMLILACQEASTLATEIRIAVPGINHAALRFAFNSGLRLTSSAHFLSTGPFGRIEQYIPSGQSLY
jgi:GNAT superfamily N-acetyltransferase